MGRPSLASRQSVLHAFTQVFIDDEWLLQGVWFNLLTTLGCVHSMMFGTFHMDFFMQRGLTALEVAAVHSFFSVWNPLNDIFAGLLVDEWVQRGFGSRLQLAFWAHVGYAVASWFAFQDLSLPVWLHYALAISSSDGFAAVASAVNGLVIIEQTEEDRQRIQIQRINSIFGCCEWLVMACAYFLWDARPASCGPFRSYLTIVCLLSVLTTAMAVKGLRNSATMGAKVGAKGRRSGGETFWQRLRPFLGTWARFNSRSFLTECLSRERGGSPHPCPGQSKRERERERACSCPRGCPTASKAPQTLGGPKGRGDSHSDYARRKKREGECGRRQRERGKGQSLSLQTG